MAHGGPEEEKVNWRIVSVALYAASLFLLILAAIFIGGPITSGICVWGVIVTAHLFIYVCINRRTKEH